MKIKFENIKKSPGTTIAGAVISLAGVASVLIPEIGASWAEAMIPIGIGITLLFLEDKPKNPGNKSGAIAIILLAALLLVTGCSTIKVPASKERASRVLAKNIRQNKAIAQTFPELLDSTKVRIEVPGLDRDTVFVDVVDSAAYRRLADLEAEISVGCSPEVLFRWHEVVNTLPNLYRDSTYRFTGEGFSSYVTLKEGNILNRVTVAPQIIYVPGETKIVEHKKPGLFDRVLRIVALLGVAFLALKLFRVL